ncbi:MAG: HIT domain-containing protein [Candidatus Thermoplasmatota archaeon]|nr:HIT domain-containing protein [Candidatus Thermoplasmatota archaeon]MCL5731673.1 HIT domain-containing protein [Candidatus Thermoplasmatota archaeon]
MSSECIFCKIATGELPSYKIYQNSNYIAFLDIYPTLTGQTLVIPKKHVGSYAFDLEDNALSDLVITSKKVAKLLERGLNVDRVYLVLEGSGVDHLHAKLYPAIGRKGQGFIEMHGNDHVRFEKYEGYLNTSMGPKAEEEELKRVCDMIVRI